MPITHSTLETHALTIETPAGRVLHTADWKVDTDPVTEAGFDDAAFAQLAGIDAIVCDSTNATVPGHSVSEGALMDGLRAEAESTRGRLIVACFASNIARLQTLGRVAVETGRYIAVYGRSLENFVASARGCGYLQRNFPVINRRHAGYLPANEVLALVTGSQGEAGSALHRLAMGTHPDLALDPHDKVIFSARTIPGNEARLERLMGAMTDAGVSVVHADRTNALLHASGHPAVEELRHMYRLVQPALAIPVHGEATHMAANAAVARAEGVASTLTGNNGDLFVIAPEARLRKRAAAAGRLEVASTGRGTVKVD